MKKSDLLRELKNEVFVRIRPSPEKGVGVFAIRDIPANINPFGEDNIKFVKVPVDEIKLDPNIPPPVKEYVHTISVCLGGYYYLPDCGLNNITSSFYVNHSKEPNLKTTGPEESFIFTTTRKVLAGEELTIDYETYNDDFTL